jgi:hypothetical protein
VPVRFAVIPARGSSLPLFIAEEGSFPELFPQAAQLYRVL